MKNICRDNWRPASSLVYSGFDNQTEGVVGYKSDYSDYNINTRKVSDCLNKGEPGDYSDYNVNKGESVNNQGDPSIIDCYNRATDAGAEFLFFRQQQQQKNDESLFSKKQTNNESFFRSKQTPGTESLFGSKQTNKRLEELKGRVGEIRSSPSPERRRINSPLLVRSSSLSSSLPHYHHHHHHHHYHIIIIIIMTRFAQETRQCFPGNTEEEPRGAASTGDNLLLR